MIWTAIFFACVTPDDCRIFGQQPMVYYRTQEECVLAVVPTIISLRESGLPIAGQCVGWPDGSEGV